MPSPGPVPRPNRPSSYGWAVGCGPRPHAQPCSYLGQISLSLLLFQRHSEIGFSSPTQKKNLGFYLRGPGTCRSSASVDDSCFHFPRRQEVRPPCTGITAGAGALSRLLVTVSARPLGFFIGAVVALGNNQSSVSSFPSRVVFISFSCLTALAECGTHVVVAGVLGWP